MPSTKILQTAHSVPARRVSIAHAVLAKSTSDSAEHDRIAGAATVDVSVAGMPRDR